MREIRPSGSMRGRGGQGVVVAANHPRLPTLFLVLKQLLNSIPRSLLKQTARKTGVDTKAGTFSVLSYLASMLFAQLSHAIRLNDVCDSLRLKAVSKSYRLRATLFFTQTKCVRPTSSKCFSGRCSNIFKTSSRALPRAKRKGPPAPFQGQDSRRRLHCYGTGRQLDWLGQTP